MARGVFAKPDGEDQRKQRSTGRTHQFATRVTLAWAEQIKAIAKRDDLYLAEVLELALDAYERETEAGSVAERLAQLILSASREEQEEAKRLVKERRDGGATGA